MILNMVVLEKVSSILDWWVNLNFNKKIEKSGDVAIWQT